MFAISDADKATWLADCSLQALGRRYEAQGYKRRAALRIVAAKSQGQLKKHQSAWVRLWCAYAKNHGGQDPWIYDVPLGCACLEAVQAQTAILSKLDSKVEQHCTAKEARMSMNYMWGVAVKGSNFTRWRRGICWSSCVTAPGAGVGAERNLVVHQHQRW